MTILLVSTYVVCERLSVMHEPAGVVEILVQNPESTGTLRTVEYPPPPPENWNLGRSWHFEYFQFWHPTPPGKMKFSHFFAFDYFQFWHPTPPPQIEIYPFLGTLSIFSFGTLPPCPPNPPPQIEIYPFLGTLSIFSLGTTPPPPKNWNLSISWHFDYFQFWHPSPPQIEIYPFLGTLSIFSFGTLPPPPPPKIDIYPFLGTLSIFSFGSLHPPPQKNWHLSISWHFEYFQFWQPTPPPPHNIGNTSDFKLQNSLKIREIYVETM